VGETKWNPPFPVFTIILHQYLLENPPQVHPTIRDKDLSPQIHESWNEANPAELY
jgi:hypothetical protein